MKILWEENIIRGEGGLACACFEVLIWTARLLQSEDENGMSQNGKGRRNSLS